ncbi:hypothetical protein [Accumulibacter sp.]|uniref:hypothetical protein n=1 Tax=Accumulibacter sp. TaxID=2053492 RepID=UPI002600F85B|nr:hypothetical protein [Accumulibacter sp.]MCM8595887.1 hypothetical protein [Accumulibacter sp.]MCM8625676.1 hypothetical protein [Accumulibacter sp.]MDS4050036.1 hypothetical protein [Accumulibacter sp.]
MSRRAVALLPVIAGVSSALLFALAQTQLARLPRDAAGPELLISLPRFAQVLLAGGDRYLAANLAGFRVLVADTGRMQAADYAVQAKLQRDIAWFNPLHEDNYYVGAAILPWNGQVDAAQYVLGRAAEARSFDWYPLFQLGFLHYHFRRDPATGAGFLLEAVPRAETVQDQWSLQNLAATWIERGYQTASAAGMVEAMAAGSPSGNFRRYLQVRAQRLRALDRLQKAAAAYRERFGRNPASLDDLLREGLVREIPRDPLGLGYGVDATGWPVLNTQPRN